MPAVAEGNDTVSKIVVDTGSSSVSSSSEAPSSSQASSSSDQSSSQSSMVESSSSEEPNPEPTSAGLITARDPQTVIDELGKLGYPGKVSTFDGDRPSISVRIAGFDTYIDFYNCAEDMTNCDTLLFSATDDLASGTTPDKANQWNTDKIVGRVWLDDNKDPTIDLSLSTFSGVSADVFDRTIKMWADYLDSFRSYFKAD